MNKWQDIYDIKVKNMPIEPLSPYKADYYFIVDKRNGCFHAKRYVTRKLAEEVAERKFKRILREVESLLVTITENPKQ